MKKIFSFTKRRKGSPSASETASVLSVGYDLKEKDLGKVHKAAFNGDVAKLKQLAKKNDLNQLDKENRTALHVACVHGHTEVVQYLVEKKVKLNLCDNQNRSALMKAVQCQQDRCVSILLEREADPNLVDINGNTALHLAARIPSVPVALKLLEHEANINAQNKERNTPLILSVEENHAEMAEFLLKEGADVNLQNQEQRTPLLIAACNGQISMLRLLLQYNADITVKDNKGWSSDDYAVMNGHHACSHLIIEHGAKRKPLQSPSHLPFSKTKQTSLLASPKTLGGPTLGKDDTEDNSHADSISRASRSGAADSWPSTDDDDNEELDLGPKKQPKLNLKKLMSASKIEGKGFAVDHTQDKSWSGTESDPISEGNAVGHMAFPGSSTSTQPPITPKSSSFSNLPLMTSTPFITSQKLPSGRKLDVEASESPEEDSVEGEDVEDGEDEDDDNEDEGEEDDEEDNEESDEEDSEEDDEESEGENEQEEETSVVKTREGYNVGEVPEMSEITAMERTKDSCDVHMQADINSEVTVQLKPSNTLINKNDDTKEHFSLLKSKASESNDLIEKAESEDTERQEIMISVITDVAVEKKGPSIGNDCLLTAIRVESTFSNEEENEYSNTGTLNAFRTPLQISGTTPGTEMNFEGDGDEENWDEDENSALIRAGKHSNFNVSKCEENTLIIESNITFKQSKIDGMVSKQPHEIGDKHITNDVKACCTVSQSLYPLSMNQDEAGNDNNEENVTGATKPSKLFLNFLRHKDEPECSIDTWGPASDNDKGVSVEGEPSDTEPGNLLVSESEVMRTEHWTALHDEKDDDDDENLPVSMIIGVDDLEDPDTTNRLPVETIAKDGDLVCHEEIPQTVIDDIDVSSHSDNDDKDGEHGNSKVEEHVNHSIPKQGTLQEKEEKSFSEDEYDEDDDEEEEEEECDEVQNEITADEHLQTSKKRDFLSELGMEKEDEEGDSPWDSESGSDSPSKKEQSGQNSPAKSHKPMSSICEESNKVLRTGQEEEDKSDEEKSEKQQKLLNTKPLSVLNKLLELKDAGKKTDVMEELGLGDVGDLEDASDWDSASTTSKASKNLPVNKYEEELVNETPVPLPVVQEQELHTSVGAAKTKREEGKESPVLKTRPMPSPRSFIPLTSIQPESQLQKVTHMESVKKPISDEESDWDTDNTSSPAKMTAPLPNIGKTETVSPPEEDAESDVSSQANEHPEEERSTFDALEIALSSSYHLAPSESQNTEVEEKEEDIENTSFHETTWEQRYEKIWVEIEKKETKSQFKNVAAELKERFGELEHKEQSETAKDKEAKEEKEEATEGIKKDSDIPEGAPEEDSSEDEEELIVRPTTRARGATLLPIPEQRESGQEESYSEELPNNDFAKNKDIQQNFSETQNKMSQEAESSSNQWLARSADTFSSKGENKENIKLSHLGKLETSFGVNQESSQEAGICPMHLVKESVVLPSVPDAGSCNSDELVEEDLQRSITEGGVTEAGVMRAELKSSALWRTRGAAKQTDVDQGKGKKADTKPDKPNPKQEGTCDSGSQKDDALKKGDHISPKWPTRSPRRRTLLLDVEENKAVSSQGNLLHVPASKQSRHPCPANHRNGGPVSVFDDSTLSEVSEDEARSPTSRHRTEKKNGEELEMADDFDDLTQSSDTATEELDSATSGYFNASLLIKQLDTSTIHSMSMVKLQNMFHEYENTIKKERNRHSRLADKVTKLEQERNELKLLLGENRESKSNLEHLRLELETDLNNLKFLLKQEQEKQQSASMLYDKTREQLFRKEEQHREEAEEREKVELKMRTLELEMRALMNNMKQMEEDRNETQRLLAHEQSARALQEDLLNSHLRKQQDLEEKNLRNLTKSTEVSSQLTEASERERELQQQVCTVQEELSSVRDELVHFRSLSRQEESRLVDERDALREKLEDARRDLKLNDETLAQTVFQYNGQVSTLKSECALLSTKLEHERQGRQQLEAEVETSKTRLQGALQETERCQAARAETERTLQREREQNQRSEEKRLSESSSQRDTIQSLSQKLSEAESRVNNLENEWHRATLSLAEKSVLLETAAREREQARARLEELEGTLQSERDRVSHATARHDAMQERLVQAQTEGALLRQQLEEAKNRGTAKEQAVTDAQECFSQALNQLRAKDEETAQIVKERSEELATKNVKLQEKNYRLEQEKADRESSLRELQQELANSLKKLSMCEASLEVNTRYRNGLEEEKARTQKEMDRLWGELQESGEQNKQAERRINNLMGTLAEKERELISSGQKLQEVLAATSRSEQIIKQLEEAVQRLEIENAGLEATLKQQNDRIEVIQKQAQEATAPTDSSPGGGVRNQLENLITNLQSSKMALEDQLSREVQKQGVLSHNAHDSQALWEEELKNRSRFGLRLAELEKEKGELSSQVELEKKKAKKVAEQKKSVDVRLDQEIKRNTELQKEVYRLRTLVKTAKKRLREQDIGELGSPLESLRGETSYRQNENEGAVSRMKIKVDELQVQLEREVSRCSKLEDTNRELKEQLSSLKSLGRSHERLERSKQQLEEELMALRRRVEAGVMDQSQAEQFRRETEERARQEVRHKLDEINLFLQTQAASQEALEQMKAANEVRQRAELEQRVRELEADLGRAHTTQQDSLLQRDSSRTELERYRQLYTDELRLRKSLASKLERSNERLAEANAKLLSERHRSKSLLSSSIINGSLGVPVLDTHSSLGRLGSGGSLLSPAGDQHPNRVEAYLAKMQSELEKNISKELDHGTSELEGASTRMSPVGSACGSQKNLNLNADQQDTLSRATQQYLEVLKKNYMI